jgi:hypothetical protein
LLHLAVKAAQQVLGRFFRVFAGYLYHQLNIVLQQGLNLQPFNWQSVSVG